MREKKVGRPAMNPDEKRKPRSIKMTDAEWQVIHDRAKQAGLSISEYIRKKAGA